MSRSKPNDSAIEEEVGSNAMGKEDGSKNNNKNGACIVKLIASGDDDGDHDGIA